MLSLVLRLSVLLTSLHFVRLSTNCKYHPDKSYNNKNTAMTTTNNATKEEETFVLSVTSIFLYWDHFSLVQRKLRKGWKQQQRIPGFIENSSLVNICNDNNSSNIHTKSCKFCRGCHFNIDNDNTYCCCEEVYPGKVIVCGVLTRNWLTSLNFEIGCLLFQNSNFGRLTK